MRQVICGLLGAAICAAVFYLTGNPFSKSQRITSCGQTNTDCACPGDDLPDPAKLTAAWDGFVETIDLLSPRRPAQETADKLPLNVVPEDALQCLMPGEDYEEEEEPTEPPTDSKAIEERLRRILESYLESGRFPGGAGLDTLDFRPDDAKRSEFERVPF